MKRSIPVLLALAALHALPAAAQTANPAAIQTPGYRLGQSPKSEKAVRGPEPPPALPGSRAESAGAAPAQRPLAEMPPTEALFDSINRGDLPGTRDAISRGADLQGTNVLGLTPLELSVDLGRNEISFLLLSLRGSSGFSGSRPSEAAAAALALFATAPAHATWGNDRGGWTKPNKPKPGSSSSSSSGGATKVPEPAGLGLFALGIAGIAAGRISRRRRNR
jgi:hypothetical protein